MGQFESLECGQLGLITQKENGDIVQIALTKEQSSMLQYIAASISQDKPLIQLPEEYNLILKTQK